MSTVTDNFNDGTLIAEFLDSEVKDGRLQSEDTSAASIFFDGINDYGAIGNVSALNITSDFTIATTITPLILDGGHRRMISKENSYYFGHRNNKLHVIIGSGGGWYNPDNVFTSTTLTLGVTYKALMTFDATTKLVSIYLNGVLDGSATRNTLGTNSNATNIATHSNPTQQFFGGDMYDMSFWARKLSGAEITTWSNGGAVSNANLIGEWLMNTGSGLTAFDTSGNGNDAALTNGPQWNPIIPAFKPESRTTSVDLIPAANASFQNFKYVTDSYPGGSSGRVSFSTDNTEFYNLDATTRIDDRGAYILDGINDDIFAPFTSDISNIGTGNFTLSARFKTTDTSSGLKYICEKSNTGSNGLVIRYEPTTDTITGGWSQASPSQVSAVVRNLNDGEWHDVIFIRTGLTTGELYVDGRLVGSGTGLTSLSLANGRLFRIGSRGSITEYFSGSIANVRLWDLALTGTEANNLSIKDEDVHSANLGLWYKMDGDATNSGNFIGQDGTVQGGAVNTVAPLDIPVIGEPMAQGIEMGDFDGINDTVDVAHNANLEANTFTVSGWVRLDGPTQSNGSTLAGKFTSGFNNGWSLRIRNNLAEFVVRTNVIGRSWTGTTVLEEGKIYRLSGHWNNATGEGKIFVNGILETQTTYVGNTYLGSTTPLKFGGATVAGNSMLNGALANICYYNDLRTDQEELDDYSNGYIDDTDPNLVSYWALNGDYIDSVGSNDGVNNGSFFSKDVRRPLEVVPVERTFDISAFPNSPDFFIRTRFEGDGGGTFSLDQYSVEFTDLGALGRRVVITNTL